MTLSGGSPTGTNNYTYDLNGSVVGKTNIAGTTTTTLYAYNVANKLSSVTGPNGSANYQYNDQGIRVRSVTGGNTTYYLVDANNHTGYAQVLEEFNVTGGVPALAKSYVLGDDVLAQAPGSSASYLLYDGHGSTRQVVNNALGVTSKYNYDAYGVTQGNSFNPSGSSLRYCGEQYDDVLNMYNLRARYYDPSNGRFNQRDMIEGNSDDPRTLHKYLYSGCDPVNVIDPTGNDLLDTLCTVSLMGILGSLVGGGIFSATGGNSVKGALLGALAGASFALLIKQNKLFEGFIEGVFQGFATAGIDLLSAWSLSQDLPSSNELFQDFFGGFAFGLANAVVENRTKSAWKVGLFGGLASAIQDFLERALSDKPKDNSFWKNTLLTAVVEAIIAYIFAAADQHEFEVAIVIGNGKLKFVKQAIEKDTSKAKTILTESLSMVMSTAYDSWVKIGVALGS